MVDAGDSAVDVTVRCIPNSTVCYRSYNEHWDLISTDDSGVATLRPIREPARPPVTARGPAPSRAGHLGQGQRSAPVILVAAGDRLGSTPTLGFVAAGLPTCVEPSPPNAVADLNVRIPVAPVC
jgi:hypothetical protein